MTKHFSIAISAVACLFSAAAAAAPGEYWEVTTKMEMEGMPFAMPSTTSKVCVPKGSENDPSKTSGDKDCKMSDVKTTGNKTTWKVRCNHDGEVMTGKGEQTTSANGYQGKMQFSGRDMDMTSAYSGKRLGGKCDTEEMVNKVKAQMCDTSQRRNTAGWIFSADLILPKDAACASQRDELCKRVHKDVQKDAETFEALLQHDQLQGSPSVAKACKVDMAATTRNICKTLNDKTYSRLAAHCPAEAKKYREAKRRAACEGRSFTAAPTKAEIDACMRGEQGDDEPQAPARTPAASGKPGQGSTDMLEGAKKLKGMFGF